MATLPDRTTANTAAEHVADHNALHDLYDATGGAADFTALKSRLAERTNVEHDLMSFNDTAQNVLGSFVVSGGTAVGGHLYVLRINADLQNNTAGDSTLTLRFRRNTTALLIHTIIVPTNVDFRGLHTEWAIHVDNDFDINTFPRALIGAPMVAAVVSADNLASRFGHRQLALTDIDWATDTTFDITAQWSVAATIRMQTVDVLRTLTTPG